ncbi:MAG: right-handed parallel beta-helix repeat-containing protein [Bdellovibrionota bacterium]
MNADGSNLFAAAAPMPPPTTTTTTMPAGSQACTVANGSGTQTVNGTQLGTCQVNSCNTGFSNFENSCIPTARAQILQSPLAKDVSAFLVSSHLETDSPKRQYKTIKDVPCLRDKQTVYLHRGETFAGPWLVSGCGDSSNATYGINAFGTGLAPIVTGILPLPAAEAVTSFPIYGKTITLPANTVRVGPLSSSERLKVTEFFSGGRRKAVASFKEAAPINVSGIGFYPITRFDKFSQNGCQHAGGCLTTGNNLIQPILTYGITRGMFTHVRSADWSFARSAIRMLTTNQIGLATSAAQAVNGFADPTPGYAFSIFNSITFLKDPGTWVIDEDTGYIYYVMEPGETLANLNLGYTLKGQNALSVYLNGTAKNSIQVQNISIFGSGEYGIEVGNALNASIKNTEVKEASRTGITYYKVEGLGEILNNQVSNCGNSGIQGHTVGKLVMSGNTISNVGRLGFHDDAFQMYGVYGAFVGDLTITNNKIDGIASSGIQVAGTIKSMDVSNNFISNYVKLFSDVGGIYLNGDLWRTTPPTGPMVISGNTISKGLPVVTTSPSYAYKKSPGVYLDFFASNVEVSRNTITDSGGLLGGIFVHGGSGNKITSNTVTNSVGTAIAIIRNTFNDPNTLNPELRVQYPTPNVVTDNTLVIREANHYPVEVWDPYGEFSKIHLTPVSGTGLNRLTNSGNPANARVLESLTDPF